MKGSIRYIMNYKNFIINNENIFNNRVLKTYPNFIFFHSHYILFSILIFLLSFSVPYGATSQVIEFSGSIVHPADGPYNQIISIRVQILKRNLNPDTDDDETETILWSKTFDQVQIHNGQYSLIFDTDDEGIAIGAAVFETKLEYEFKTQQEVDRANLPNGNYALRFYMRRTQNEEWERIKPDFNMDSAPYSVSALKLSGADTKIGNFIIQSVPGIDENNLVQTGAVLTLDTQPDDIKAKDLAAGFYLENGTLNISVGTSNNNAIDMEGSLYLKDSFIEVQKAITLTEGNLVFERLCMSLNCEADIFKNTLRANNLMILDEFIDNASSEENPYNLKFSETSHFQSLSIMNLSTGINGTLHMMGESNINLRNYAGLRVNGTRATLSLVSGNIIIDNASQFSNLNPNHFRLEDETSKLRDEDAQNFADPQYFKISASKLRSSNIIDEISPYFIKPSSTSNIRALQFHFYDLNKARLRINARVQGHRFVNSFSKHKVNVLFDPVFTEEIFNGLISGGLFNFHNHDLIAQASEKELMEIINSSEFVDDTTIDLTLIDSSLMKETFNNIWPKPTYFYGILPVGIEKRLFSSLRLQKNLEISAGGDGQEKPRVIFGGVQHQNDIDVAFINDSTSAKSKSFGFFGTRSLGNHDVHFLYKNKLLNLKAGSLVLNKKLELTLDNSLLPSMDVFGEINLDGNININDSLEIEGALLAGCFGAQNLNAAISTSCLGASTISASNLINISTLTATIFTDKSNGDDNTKRYFNPHESSLVKDIVIQNTFNFLGNANLDAPIVIKSDFIADAGSIGTTNNHIASEDFNTIVTGPAYKFDPNKISFINHLNVSEDVDIQEDFVISSTNKLLSMSSSFYATSIKISGVTTLTQGLIFSKIFVDATNSNRYLDPDQLSELTSLQLDGNLELAGDITIDGNLSLNTGLITIDQGLQFHGTVKNSSSIIDLDNQSYSADPNFTSTFNKVNISSQLKTSYLTAKNLDIGGSLKVGNNAFFDTNLLIDQKTEGYSRIIMPSSTSTTIPECRMNPDGTLPSDFQFCVTNDGVIYARSAHFTDTVTVEQSADFDGNIVVLGKVDIHSPTWFQEVHLHLNDLDSTFSIVNQSLTTMFSIDSFGNTTSTSGGIKSTGTIRFLANSAKAILVQTNWTFGTENSNIRHLRFQKANNDLLNLYATEMTSLSSAAGSLNFEIAQSTTLQRYIDSQNGLNNETFSIILSKTATLNQMTVNDTKAVTQIISPILSPDLSDFDDTNYFINLSSQSNIKDLTVNQELLLHNDFRVFNNIDNFQSKISIIETSSTSPYMILSADSYFSIDRLGNLSSSLDFLHHGQLEIVDSILNLGVASSVYSIGHLTMVTLIVQAGTSYDADFDSNYPNYFADHLHTHDTISNVHISQMARKDLANIFTGENRFLNPLNSISLIPSASAPSNWSDNATIDTQRYFPWVLPTNNSFLLAHGYNDILLSASNNSVLKFHPQTSNFSNITNHSSLGLKYLSLSYDKDFDSLFVTGGLDGASPSDQLFRYNSNSWNSAALIPKKILYHQSLTINNKAYLFGGFFESSSMMYPTTQNFVGDETTVTEHVSNFPINQQMLEESFIYVRANTLYRNNLSKTNERAILTYGSGINKPSVSKLKTDICFHDNAKTLIVYNLILDKITTLGNGHHCQWGQSNSNQDTIYYITGTNDYGIITSKTRDGLNPQIFGGTITNYEIRDLNINSSNSVAMIARATMTGLNGERLLLKQSDDSIIQVDSDDTDQITFMSSADDFHDLIVKNNQLFSLSSNKSHNSKTNLFASLTDGTDTTQVSFFPQGISNRPVILDSQEAIVAVSAFATISNKLPLLYRQNCSTTYQNKVYLFGSGLSKNQIQEYSPKSDTFYTLSETLPFPSPFSCTFDNTNKAYFQSGEKFWYFSMIEKKFWPLADITGMDTNTAGSISYDSDKVYFIDYQTSSNSNFLSYSTTSSTWTSKSTPNKAYDKSNLIALKNDIFLMGNRNGIYNQKYDTGSNTWTPISTQASIAGTDAFNIHLTIFDDQILLVGGKNSVGITSTLFLYDTDMDSFQTLPSLKRNTSRAGTYLNNNQLYIFGGANNNQDLMIHPINTVNSNNFQQIFSLNLNSGARTWLSSAPRFAYADINTTESTIAYSSGDFGISLFDISTKSHSSIRPSTEVSAVTNIRFAKDNDYLYFSQKTSTSEDFLRVTSDGANVENLSISKLNGATGTLQFVSNDHQRLYFIKNNQPYYSMLNSNVPPVAFKDSSNVQEIIYHSNTNVEQRRDGILLEATDTTMSALTDTYFKEIILREVQKSENGDYLFSAKSHFQTTNLYILEAGKSELRSITNLQGTTYAKSPFVSPFDHKTYYTKVVAGTPQLIKIEDSTETPLSLSNSFDLISQDVFEAKNHKNLSFKVSNRFYTLVKQKVYRTQTLNNTPQALTWALFDELPQVNNNQWQITQYKNRVYFYDENQKDIYQYYPQDKSLNFISKISSIISSGSLAVTSDSFYLVGNGSISQVASLQNPSKVESVQVFSADNSNTDTSALKILSFDPNGNAFLRQMIGNANFDNQTVSGGKGDLGILDGSLSLDDIANTTITGTKIIDLSFDNQHIVDNNIYSENIADQQILGLHFTDSVITSSKLSNLQVDTRHIAISTIQSDKLSNEGFTNIDFADRSIKTDHIKTNSISNDVIKDRSLLSSNFKDQSIESLDILDYTMSTKQILDGSIQDIDIDTQTLLTRHFLESSVTTNKLSDYNVLNDKITDYVLKTQKFEDYTIETSDIAPLTIIGSLLLSEALTSGHMINHTSGLSTDNLNDFLITKDKIADDAVDDSKVETNSIASIDIETLSITFRELATGSISTDIIIDYSLVDCQLTTWSSNLPGNCTSSVLKSDAITIGKLSNLTLDTQDFSNNSIYDRHFFSGGYGEITTLANITMDSRDKPVVAIFENEMLIFGGAVGLNAKRFNLSNKLSYSFSELDGLDNQFAYVVDQNNLDFFADSTFYRFDYQSKKLKTYTSATFTGSDDKSAKALLHNGDFYFIGGQGTHTNKIHKLALDEVLSAYGNTTNTLPNPISAMSTVEYGGKVYLYGGTNGTSQKYITEFDGTSYSDVGNLFIPSSNHQSIVYSGQVFITGGVDQVGILIDKTYRSPNPNSFSEIGTLPTGGLKNHSMTVFNNRIFILGGETIDGRIDEVHSTTDGITWTRHSRPPWSPRSKHQTIVFDDKLFLIGGNTLSGDSNEIYSTIDGDNWVKHSDGSFSARSGHKVIKHRNFLVLTGGNETDDTFTSRDGINWKDQSSTTFTGISHHQSVSYQNKVFVFGGINGGAYQNQSKFSILNPLTISSYPNLPQSLSGTEHLSYNGKIYLFANNEIYSSPDHALTWNLELDSFGLNFIGSSAITYNDQFYIFGGISNKNSIYKFDPALLSLEALNMQNIDINSSGINTNQVVLYQHRFYIPSSSVNKLLLWHPNSDASIATRNIDDAGIQSSNIKSNSLASINFSIDSILSNNIISATITGLNIKDNTLTDHAIADSIFTGEQFKPNSITSSKLASFSIDSRVISDQSLIDSDFATQSIDARVLANQSIGFDEIKDGSITSNKLKNNSITLSKLTTQSVHGEDIITHEIKTVDIADETINNRVIADQNILTSHIKNREIKSRHIQDSSIIRVKFLTHTIQNIDISEQAFNATTMFLDRAILNQHIKDFNITNSKISTATANQLTNSKFLSNTLSSSDILNLAIKSYHFATSSIIQELIKTHILLDRSFGTKSIKTHHLIDLSLRDEQFLTNSIDFTSIASSTITSQQILDGSIYGHHLISFTLRTEDFKDGSIGLLVSEDSIDYNEITQNSLLSEDFSDDSITTRTLSFASIFGEKITTSATNKINNNKFALSQITSKKLKPNSIITEDLNISIFKDDKFLQQTLTSKKIALNQLKTTQIKDKAIFGHFLFENTIENRSIENLSVSSRSIASFQILSGHIVDQSILSEHIDTDAITFNKLTTDTFDSSHFIDGTISGDSIVNFSLSHDQLFVDAVRNDIIATSVISQFYMDDTSSEIDSKMGYSLGTFGNVIRLNNGIVYLIKTGDKILKKFSPPYTAGPDNLGINACTTSIEAAFFFNTEVGYVVCNNWDIMYTADAATTWAKTDTAPGDVKDIHFFNQTDGVLILNSKPNQIYYSTSSGRNWTFSHNGDNGANGLLPWTIYQDTIYIANYGLKTLVSIDHGQTFNTHTHTFGTDAFQSMDYNPLDDALYSIIDIGTSTYKLHKSVDSGANWTTFSFTAALQTSFQNSRPQGIKALGNYIYIATFNASFSMWRYDVNNSDLKLFTQVFETILKDSTSNTQDLNPTYLSEGKFLITQSDNNLTVFEATSFKHIKDSSLISNSLDIGALTTHNFIKASINGDKFNDNAIKANHIQNDAFSHGEYVVYNKSTNPSHRLISIKNASQGIISITSDFKNIKLSTNGASSFSTVISTNASFRNIHGRGNNFSVGVSNGDIYLSTNSAASFFLVTNTPYTKESLAYAFDANNFFAIGAKNNQLIPSKYNQSLNEFVSLKNLSSGEIVITTGDNLNPNEIHFLDGKTAYLSLRRQSEGGIVFKTTNGGYNWSPIFSAAATVLTSISFINVISDGKIWIGANQELYETTDDNPSLKYTFTDVIRGVYFVSETLGFVLAGDNAYLTRDGGDNFREIFTGTSQVKAITVLPQDRFLFSNLTELFEIRPQYDHQPFTNLTANSFSSTNPMGEKQIAQDSLKILDINAGALSSDAFADSSLTGNKLKANSIATSHIITLSLEGGHFDFGSINSTKLASDGISGQDMKARIITSEMIKDGTLDSTVIATSVLGADSLGIAAITTEKVKDASFFGETLKPAAITTSKLIDDTFTSEKFSLLSFESKNFTENSVQSANLSAGFSLENDKISTEVISTLSFNTLQVNSRMIQNSSLLSYLITTNSIIENKLQNSSIETKHFAHQSITRAMLFSPIVTSGALSSESVSGHSFITNTISRANYSSVSIPFNKIADFTITSREFNNDSIIAGKFSIDPLKQIIQSKFSDNTINQSKVSGDFSALLFNDNAFTNNKFFNRPFSMSEMKTQNLTYGHFISRELLNASFENGAITTGKLSNTDDFSTKLANDSIQSINIISHSLNNNNFNADLTVVKIENKAIFSSQLGLFTNISTVKDDSITSQTIQLDSLLNEDLTDNAIKTAQLINTSITSIKIADDFVDNTMVTTPVINSAKIKLNDLIANDFANETITTSKLQSQSLTGGNFVIDILTFSNMQSDTIFEGKIDNLTIGASEIDDNAIQSRHIEADSINIGAIAPGSIQSSDIHSRTLLSTNIQDNSLTSTEVAPFAIESQHIKDHELTSSQFTANTIKSASISGGIPEIKIGIGQIKNADLATNTINATKFVANTITGSKFQTNQIISAKIIDNTVDGAKFDIGNISQSKLNNIAIETQNIIDNTLNTVQIANATLNADKLEDNTLIDRNFAINAINNTLIKNNSVTISKLDTDSITNADLFNDLVAEDFTADSILNNNIVDKSLLLLKLNLGSINNVDIIPNSLGWENLAANAILETHIANDTINQGQINNNVIIFSKFTDNTIIDRHFVDESINDTSFTVHIPGSKFANHAFKANKIDLSSVIISAKITNEVSAGKIQDNNITLLKFNSTRPLFSVAENSKMASNSVSSLEFPLGEITTQKINGQIVNSVAFDTSDKLGNNEIFTNFITSSILGTDLDNTKVISDVTGLNAGLISTDKLKNLSFGTSHITDGILTKSHLSTSETTFQKLFDLGDGESHADGIHKHDRPATTCPTGFSKVGDADFCVMDVDDQSVIDSITTCRNNNARLCSLKDYITVCKKASGNLAFGKNYNTSNFVGIKSIGFTYKNSCDFEDNPQYLGLNQGAGGARKALCCYSN